MHETWSPRQGVQDASGGKSLYAYANMLVKLPALESPSY